MAVKGLSALRIKLRDLPNAVKKEIGKPMETAAQNIVDLAYHLCPVLTIGTLERRPGQLRSTIDWQWGPPPGGTLTGAAFKNYAPGDLKLSIYAGGPDAPYVGHVEFGTSKMNAEPFFYPAYRSYQKQMKRAAKSAANNGIKRIAQFSRANI